MRPLVRSILFVVLGFAVGVGIGHCNYRQTVRQLQDQGTPHLTE